MIYTNYHPKGIESEEYQKFRFFEPCRISAHASPYFSLSITRKVGKTKDGCFVKRSRSYHGLTDSSKRRISILVTKLTSCSHVNVWLDQWGWTLWLDQWGWTLWIGEE